MEVDVRAMARAWGECRRGSRSVVATRLVREELGADDGVESRGQVGEPDEEARAYVKRVAGGGSSVLGL